jgi:DHA1 family bicyclomycin/chloramphenicol resistance-like MFS transporter
VMAISGIFTNGAPKPMVIGIAICAVLAYVITQLTVRAETRRLPAAAE